jgi:hypothetical protein
MAVCVAVCAREFYAIQAVKAVAKPIPFKHSHERWLRDFDTYASTYVSKFSEAMFDYITLICFGEARHAYAHTDNRWRIVGVPRGGGRSPSYSKALRYDPWDVLRKCAKVFSVPGWDTSYGGKSWARIANAGLMRAKLDAESWLDHCVDLSHNSGLCFDKIEADIFSLATMDSAGYKAMLDLKANCSPERFIAAHSVKCSRRLRRLILRAVLLRIIETITVANGLRHFRRRSAGEDSVEQHIAGLLGYAPTLWGTVKLGAVVKYYGEGGGFEECEEEEEEEEEEAGGEDHVTALEKVGKYGVSFVYAPVAGCGYSRN